MTKRQLKNRTQFTSTLSNDNYAALKQLAEDTRINMSKLLDEAIELLLAKRK
jgi:predicted transcriptional regulator